MSADAERNVQSSSTAEELRQAALRVRRAHETYTEFVAVSPLPPHDIEPARLEEMKVAKEEIEAAEQQYARLLREDPLFIKKSAEAEQRLKEGPPWSDVITPSDLGDESSSKDR